MTPEQEAAIDREMAYWSDRLAERCAETDREATLVAFRWVGESIAEAFRQEMKERAH